VAVQIQHELPKVRGELKIVSVTVDRHCWCCHKIILIVNRWPIRTITMSNSERQGRTPEDHSYICELENLVERLEDEVQDLRAQLAMSQGKKHSKKELRELYGWNDQDILFSNTVMTFCKEFLFPRIKFLGKGWSENNPSNKKSFSEVVRRHLPMQRGMTFDGTWNRIIAPTIAKKYTDIRCNINGDCRTAFVGKSLFDNFSHKQYFTQTSNVNPKQTTSNENELSQRTTLEE